MDRKTFSIKSANLLCQTGEIPLTRVESQQGQKQSSDRSTPETHDRSTPDSRNSINSGVNAPIKEQKTSETGASGGPPTNPPGNQVSSGGNGGQNRFASSRRCYHCGKYGHFKRDCPKFKQVNIAHVPSLAEMPNDPITVPGMVGSMEIREMLCDSRATISVVSDSLVPEGSRKCILPQQQVEIPLLIQLP